MIDKQRTFKVTNRSGSTVSYSIPEMNNLRRVFAADETKTLSYEELEKLTYIPGGSTLIANYLLIREEEVIENLVIHAEPEYHLNREQVIQLMLTGSMDAFLDCLDFAPEGVLQIVKDVAVSLPLNDVQKREAIKTKLGFDVSAAISNKNIAFKVAERAVGAEDTGISFIAKTIENQSFATEVTEASRNVVLAIFMIALPLAMIALGVYVYIRRKNS